MYCHNCGKQIPDGVAYCTFCGTKQEAAAPAAEPSEYHYSYVNRPAGTPAQPRHAAPEPPRRQSPERPPQRQPAPAQARQQKPKKKWTAILIPVLVFFAAGLVGRFVIAPSMQKGNNRPDIQQTIPTIAPIATVAPIEAGEAFTPADTQESDAGSAYSAVFEGSGVIHLPILMASNVVSFAKMDEEGDIDCLDYGYTDDMVTCYAETWYYLGVTSDQQEYIQNLTAGAEQEIEKYSGVSCISVKYEYNEAGSYFKIRYDCTGLDSQENIQAMYDLGLISSNDGISMSRSEQEMLAQGYVKR